MYGARFLTRRKHCENIIDHRSYLKYLGKLAHNMDYLWGNNKSMINYSTVPDAKLHKRHNILSFHFVRSMVSQGYINILHIVLKYSFANILTKHWGYQDTYHELIQSIFHHEGNTSALFLDNTIEVDTFSTEEKMIFSLLESDKLLCDPQ